MAGSCAELGPDARMAGAVNTVRIEGGGRLVGECSTASACSPA
jgi:shikimate 5-dehydrogenase